MWLTNLIRAINKNGGLVKSYLTLVRTDDLKIGEFMGTDKMGNRYYQSDYYFYGRNRWVIYSDRVGYDYDASQIHPDWFSWIHHTTDETPVQKPREPYPWMLPYEENQTGTPNQYVPYSTTKPKIIPWTPPKPGTGQQSCKTLAGSK